VTILFCRHPLEKGVVDPDYEEEWEAAGEAGFARALLDFEGLLAGRPVPVPTDGPVLYRGWMLKPRDYARLAGPNFVTTVEQYRHCHHLPEWYPALADVTPASVWTSELSLAWETLQQLPAGPAIVKDFVKSCKHHWDEACFLPDTRDEAACRRVVARFLELQGADLNEGLVFREFCRLKPVGAHPASGMPLTEEYRLFCWDGAPFFQSRYWGEADYAGELPSFAELSGRVRSRFFTMDVARREDGDWIVMELGDAQVAGLPEGSSATDFYRALREAL